MVTYDHPFIDARLLRLVQACVERLELTPDPRQPLRANVARWPNARLRAEWNQLLDLPWPELRARLLAETEAAAALRQNAPLGGILPPLERLRIMQDFAQAPRLA